MKKTIAWGLVLLLAPIAVAAQTTYVDIEQRLTAEQLQQVGLSPAQLELLNRMLREGDTGEPTTQAVAADAHESPEPVSENSEQKQTQARRSSSYIGLNDEPIHSRLKGSVSGWEPGTVFELENGQQWKVLKGQMKLREARQSPEIVVVPGVAGRLFLQVDEDMPKARVYRID